MHVTWKSDVTNTNIMELGLSNFGIIFEKQMLGTLRPVTTILVGVILLCSLPYVDTVYLLYVCVLPHCKCRK
jgi:hypothetical protein